MIHRRPHHRSSLWSRSGLWLLAILLAGTTTASADWPMSRQNNQRTATATKASELAKPALRWRRYLGGSLPRQQMTTFDVDGDGTREILYVVGGRLVAETPLDMVVYESEFLDLSDIITITDVDNDGSQELVARALAGRVYLLSPYNGQTIWAMPPNILNAAGAVLVADFTADGLPDLYVGNNWSGTPGERGDQAVVYEFSDGASAGTEQFSVERGHLPYYRGEQVAVGDIDGDGVVEIIAQSSNTFALFSGTDGSFECDLNVGTIPYSQARTRLVDVDADGRPEIVAFTHSTHGLSARSRRVFLLDWDETSGCLVKVWDRSVANLETDEHQFGDGTVVDVDGDGDLEVVTSFGSDETWQTLVLNAATGEQLTVADIGPYRGTADLTGDGKPEIVTGDAKTDGLRVYSMVEGELALIWSTTKYVPVTTRDSRRTYEREIWQLQSFDVDGDGPAELLVQTVSEDLPPTLAAISFAGDPQAIAEFTAPAEVTFQTFERATNVTRPYDQLLLVRSDGYLVALDKDFHATNFSSSEEFGVEGMQVGGFYSGRAASTYAPVAADLDGDGADEVLIRDSRDVLLSLEPLGANLIEPPAITWEAVHSRSPTVFTRNGQPVIVTYSGLGADSRLMLYSAAGNELWRRAAPNLYWAKDAVVGDLDGDGSPEIAYLRLDDVNVVINPVRSEDGSDLWLTPFVTPVVGSGLGLISLWDRDDDGLLDLLTAPAGRFWWRKGSTGATIGTAVAASYGSPIFQDVTGDGIPEVFTMGAVGAPRMFTLDLTQQWAAASPAGSDKYKQAGVVALCDGGARLVQPVANQPRVLIFDVADASLIADIAISGGQLYPSYDDAGLLLGYVGSATISPDLVGAGRPSALIPSTDGFLYALDVCGSTVGLDWAMDFRRSVGEASLADTDGDGYDEILVTVADGYLYAIDTEALPAPGYVLDRDSLTAGDDIDQLETSDTLWAQWEPVAEATSYQYAVITQGGTIITTPDFVDAGTNTAVEISGLDLALDTTYRVAVRAVNADGTSAEVMSDGVTVMDGTAPRIENLAATPTTFSPLLSDYDDTTVISGTLVDGRALASATWEVEDASGQRVLAPIALESVTGTEYHLAFSWDAKNTAGEVVAPGNYSIKVTVTDAENYWTTGSVIVTVADETTGMPDAGPVVGSDAGLGQVRVDDGCNCTVGDRGPSASGLLLTFLVLLGARRRRNRG